MKSRATSPLTGSGPRSVEDAFSGAWFARYVLDAVFLVVLMLTAIGIALYLEAGEYLHDWSKQLGACYFMCLLLCPMLGVVTLGLVIYAGIRLFLRPRTLGHAVVRLALLAAHVSVFLVCADTISSTATALVGRLGQSSSALDPTEAWRTINRRDFPDAQDDTREGEPDAPPFPSPPRIGVPGLTIPGGGSSSR